MLEDYNLIRSPSSITLDTHTNSAMPVLAMAYDKPSIPLPMMALPRLNTDIPNEAVPGC